MSVFVDDSINTMERFNHAVLAEESITKYITLLEKDSDSKMPEEDKVWLYRKGKEIFDTYYISERLVVSVLSERDNRKISDYVELLQDNMSKMFAHILISEFKIYLIEKKLRGE